MLCFGNFAGLGHQQYNIAIAVSSSTFYLPLWERFWHQSDIRGWCHVVFKYHFWGQNGSTFKACKIVSFNARRLKLWNCVFDNFKTEQKQISLHRHFNLEILFQTLFDFIFAKSASLGNNNITSLLLFCTHCSPSILPLLLATGLKQVCNSIPFLCLLWMLGALIFHWLVAFWIDIFLWEGVTCL